MLTGHGLKDPDLAISQVNVPDVVEPDLEEVLRSAKPLANRFAHCWRYVADGVWERSLQLTSLALPVQTTEFSGVVGRYKDFLASESSSEAFLEARVTSGVGNLVLAELEDSKTRKNQSKYLVPGRHVPVSRLPRESTN